MLLRYSRHGVADKIHLDQDSWTALVTDLTPSTEYLFTLFAFYADRPGDSTMVKGRTSKFTLHYNILLICLFFFLKAPLPKVSNFRVTEEGLFSLKVAWSLPFGKLDGYKIYIPRTNRPGLAYEQVLSAEVSSHLIDNLQEDKEYTVSIYAVYLHGPSNPVSVNGRTLKLVPVQNLTLQNATTDTIQVRWSPVRGASGYRLTWSSTEGYVQNVNLGETYSFYMIRGLQPNTEYTVAINPIFVDIEGPVVNAKHKTLASSSVQKLKASATSTSSAQVSWNSVPGATGYRLAWGPTAEFFGKDRPRQLALNSSTTIYLLRNLAHDTEYVISLYVLFGSVVGPGITTTVRTSPLGYVSNFKVTAYTSTSISITWSATVGATEYKIAWSPESGSGAAGTQYLDRRVLSHRIEKLLPDTLYMISVHAVFGNSEGPEVTLTQSTASLTDLKSIPSVRDLRIVDTGVDSLKLTWKNPPGISGYRISWTPFNGGPETSKVIPANATFFTISGLQESSTYTVRMLSVVGHQEGSPVLLTARTLHLPKVLKLEITEMTENAAVVSWTRVPRASAYSLSWRLVTGTELMKEQLAATITAFKVGNLVLGRTYVFTIWPIFGNTEGPATTLTERIVSSVRKPITRVTKPTASPSSEAALPTTSTLAASPLTAVTTAGTIPVLASTETTTSTSTRQPRILVIPTTMPAPPASTAVPEPICGKMKADIVFLVDESWSIGHDNFAKIKEFLFRVVSYFPKIGPEGTQVAVVHYSEEPRIEFRLNQHKDRNAVLKALKVVRYGGGNTRTGRAMGYVLKEVFQEFAGMRENVSHVLVLLTDGRSQDDVIPPARVTHALGIRVIAVGINAADIEELKTIVFNNNYKEIFFASTFDDLPLIEGEFIENVCSGETFPWANLHHTELAEPDVDKPQQTDEVQGEPSGPNGSSSGADGGLEAEGPCKLCHKDPAASISKLAGLCNPVVPRNAAEDWCFLFVSCDHQMKTKRADWIGCCSKNQSALALLLSRVKKDKSNTSCSHNLPPVS
ncbi:collagen alpha-1(XIV) chain [Latimeria chalumnae]|uniref:collagen alpha-1(XIV) chain n=1 Tax=Latimeria chalumnae TaxID=7897 RepID=UPI00313B2FE0